ncbi:carboxylate--amine ligase [Saccharopolyspora taberi]|uniref:ATP-grasp domain-containing protein n=1 Tax=Saccharopolyspora taberi TaxID=60895 RepID=A0ABN3V2H9_9PSEU
MGGNGFDTSVPAVVFKLDPNVMHHGGLGVIRGLGRVGVPVYAVQEHAYAPAAHSRYLRGHWVWRPDPDDVDEVLRGLRRVAERIGRVSVLFPTDDAGAIFLAEHGAALREWFHFPDPPRHLPRTVAGKYSMHRMCRELGVPCAEAAMVDTLAQAEEFAAGTGFPLVAKLATPWRKGGELRSTTIVHNGQDLAEVYRLGAGASLLLQEYLPGGRDHDWFFHGYCDRDSRCRAAFVGLKERSYPAHAGLTSLGRWAENAQLRGQAEQLLHRIGFRGIVDLDFRWDARDSQYKLLDFNPRLGAQFRLFTDTAGVDVALAAYLDLTGQPVPPGEAVPGRRFLVENYDPIAALRYWRDGELDPLTWARSMRAVGETAWFAADDLVPFALMCLWMGARAAGRPLRKLPLRAGKESR